ncbi:RagB/SusD family nutrient uptake outer membrane protein [Bacteroides graminisolvens]|uniref:RagB/SusD family nutrient uptake outer membrane protein n=1 Tax=Bacteroides graminisolvens TaxID=477666 RepID=UPI003B70BD65
MKKINIFNILSCGLLLFASCDDFLDTTPDNRAEIDTSAKITSLLTSAYAANSFILLTELSSDNTMDNGAQYTAYNEEQEDAYLWKDITTTGNDSPKSVWDANYAAVAAANQALKAIEDLGSPASLNPQKGEALLCRAYGHFTLANVFCMAYNPLTADKDMGLPYSEKPETQVFVKYERGTMAELYDKIYKDLEEGLPLVNDGIYSVPKYHFNKKAAYAFAARFNLFYHKYDKAIQYATVAVGDASVKNFRDWSGIAASASNWDARTDAFIAATEPANLLLQTAVSAWPYVYGPYSLGKRYGNARAIFTRESVRVAGLWGAYANLYPGSSVWGSDQKLAISKLKAYFEYTDKAAGIGYLHLVDPVFTTDEALLCRAEAYALKADYTNALADINTWLKTHTKMQSAVTLDKIVEFYSALPYMPLEPATDAERNIKKEINPQGFTVSEGQQENVIQCILHLRRIETMHEGLRWLDIKRYGIEIAHNRDGLAYDVLKTDDPRRAIQLPQDVISAGLTANPRTK